MWFNFLIFKNKTKSLFYNIFYLTYTIFPNLILRASIVLKIKFNT